MKHQKSTIFSGLKNIQSIVGKLNPEYYNSYIENLYDSAKDLDNVKICLENEVVTISCKDFATKYENYLEQINANRGGVFFPLSVYKGNRVCRKFVARTFYRTAMDAPC